MPAARSALAANASISIPNASRNARVPHCGFAMNDSVGAPAACDTAMGNSHGALTQKKCDKNPCASSNSTSSPRASYVMNMSDVPSMSILPIAASALSLYAKSESKHGVGLGRSERWRERHTHTHTHTIMSFMSFFPGATEYVGFYDTRMHIQLELWDMTLAFADIGEWASRSDLHKAFVIFHINNTRDVFRWNWVAYTRGKEAWNALSG